MDFDLSDEQKAIRDSVSGLLRDHCTFDRAVANFDRGTLDNELWWKMSELGIASILVPESDAGLELGLLTLAIISEALGYAAADLPIATNALAAWLLANSDDDAQKSRWIEEVMAGDIVACFATSEADNSWAPQTWQLDGETLSGTKIFVEYADSAGLFIVGLKDSSFALIKAADAGIKISAIDSVDRTRPLFEVSFSETPYEKLQTDGETAARLIDAQLVLLAADAMGAASRTLQLAVDYAKERKQFDRIIGSFQGLKHQLADMTAKLEPCRPLYWYAAHAWDELPEERAYAAAMTKAHVCDVAVQVARGTVEAHGGIGYTWEYPLHIWLKRAMYDRAAMGLPVDHRLRAAALSNW